MSGKQWLFYIVLGFLVYAFLPSRVRVAYLLIVGLGGVVYADKTGGLKRLKDTLAGI